MPAATTPAAAPTAPMSAPQLQRALAEAQHELLAGAGGAALRSAHATQASTGTLAAVTRAGSRLERIADGSDSAAPPPERVRAPASSSRDNDDEHDALPASRLRLAPSVLRSAAPRARRASSAASASSSSPPSSPRSPLSPGLASPPPQWASALSWSPPRGPSPAPGAQDAAPPRELPGIAAARALLDAVPARPRLRPAAASLACAGREEPAAGPGTAGLDTHGTASRSATPSFFLQSFPDTPSVSATTATHEALPLLPDSSAEPSPSLSTALLSSSPTTSSPRRSAPTLARPSAGAGPTLLSKSTAPSALSATSATVRLHGNARSAREYGDANAEDDSALPLSGSRLQSSARDDSSSDGSLAELAPEAAARPRHTRSASGSSSRSWQSGTSVASADAQTLPAQEATTTSAPPPAPTRGRFARDVHCVGWAEVGGKAKGHVEYEIRVLTKSGTTVTVFRRFSSFVALRKALGKARPAHAAALPALHTRHNVLQKYSPALLQERRAVLERWLRGVMLDRRWGGATAVQEWLLQ